jgi:hypothetical protein
VEIFTSPDDPSDASPVDTDTDPDADDALLPTLTLPLDFESLAPLSIVTDPPVPTPPAPPRTPTAPPDDTPDPADRDKSPPLAVALESPE